MTLQLALTELPSPNVAPFLLLDPVQLELFIQIQTVLMTILTERSHEKPKEHKVQSSSIFLVTLTFVLLLFLPNDYFTLPEKLTPIDLN